MGTAPEPRGTRVTLGSWPVGKLALLVYQGRGLAKTAQAIMTNEQERILRRIEGLRTSRLYADEVEEKRITAEILRLCERFKSLETE